MKKSCNIFNIKAFFLIFTFSLIAFGSYAQNEYSIGDRSKKRLTNNKALSSINGKYTLRKSSFENVAILTNTGIGTSNVEEHLHPAFDRNLEIECIIWGGVAGNSSSSNIGQATFVYSENYKAIVMYVNDPSMINVYETYLFLEDDGELMYSNGNNGAKKPIYVTTETPRRAIRFNKVGGDQIKGDMLVGDYIESGGKAFTVGRNNIELSIGGKSLWSVAFEEKIEKFNIGNDGNAVVYGRNNKILWETNTKGRGGSGTFLKIQEDFNLVLYNGSWTGGNGDALWATGTCGCNLNGCGPVGPR